MKHKTAEGRGNMDAFRLFRGLASLALLAGVVTGASGPQSEVFVHISDTHVMDLQAADPQVAEVRRPALPATGALMPVLKKLHSTVRPAFLLHSGDIADGYSFLDTSGKPVYGQVELAHQMLANSPIPVYAVLGNHDLSHYAWTASHADVAPDQAVAGAARAAWVQQLPCFRNGSYYVWERTVGSTHYLFLMLDNGYHAGDPSNLSKESRQFRLSAEQRQWLRSQVQTHPDHVLMLTMHVPLTKDDMTRSVKEALAGHARPVFAFAGHTHTVDAVEDLEWESGHTLHQIRTPGFVLGANNWRQIRLHEDHVEIFRTGTTEQVIKTFPLSAAAAAVP